MSSQGYKCYAGFEKDIEYNTDVEFKEYTTKKHNGDTCILQNISNTSNSNTNENERLIL